MPQEFQVVRCYSCQTFQGQQVKKAKKWSCKVCGEKQSYSKIYGQGNGKECRIHVQKLNAMAANMQRGLDEEVEVEEDGKVERRYDNDDDDDDDDDGGGPSASTGFGNGGTVGLSPNMNKTASRWQRYLDKTSPDVNTKGRSPRQGNHGPSHYKRHDTPSTSMHNDSDGPKPQALRRRDNSEQRNAQWARRQDEDKQHNALQTRSQYDDESCNALQARCQVDDEQRNALQTRRQDNAEQKNAQRKKMQDDGELFSSSFRFGKYREANNDKTPSSLWAPLSATSSSTRSETVAVATSVAESPSLKSRGRVSGWSKYLETGKSEEQGFIKENSPKKPRLSSDGFVESERESKDSPSRSDRSDLGPLVDKAKGISPSTNLFPEMSESEWTDLFEGF